METSSIKCPNCGATLPANSKFCGKCGTSLAGIIAPAAASVVKDQKRIGKIEISKKILIAGFIIAVLASGIFSGTIVMQLSAAKPPVVNTIVQYVPSTSTFVIERNETGIYHGVRYDGNVTFEDTDAGTVIEDVITNMTSGGTFCTRGAGQTWLINTKINITSDHVTWISDWSLTLKAKNGLNDDVIEVDGQGVLLHGLHIDGNGENQASGEHAGISFTSTNNGIVDMCKIHNCKRFGIDTYNVNNCTFSNNVIYGVHDFDTVANLSKGYGIFLWGNVVGDALYNRVINNIVYDVQLDCIGLHQQKFFEISGNTIYDGDTYGIPAADSHCGVISDNQISNCSRAIVQVIPTSGLKCSYVTISGNEIECNKNTNGIYIMGDNNTISANNIYNYHYQGIVCTGNLNVFSGNKLTGVLDACGFYVTGSNNLLSSNAIYGGSKPGININGGNDNVILGNIVDNTASYNSSAIELDNADRTMIDSNKIIGHGIPSNYSISIDASSDGTKICANMFEGMFPSGILQNLGSNTTANLNKGFVTENSGSLTTAANGTVINHGLAGTPRSVTLASGNATETVFCSTTLLTPTQFTIVLIDDTGAPATGQTVYWTAEYAP